MSCFKIHLSFKLTRSRKTSTLEGYFLTERLSRPWLTLLSTKVQHKQKINFELRKTKQLSLLMWKIIRWSQVDNSLTNRIVIRLTTCKSLRTTSLLVSNSFWILPMHYFKNQHRSCYLTSLQHKSIINLRRKSWVTSSKWPRSEKWLCWWSLIGWRQLSLTQTKCSLWTRARLLNLTTAISF